MLSPDEKSEFRKSFLLKIFSDPMVLIPFGIGSTFLAGSWAIGGGIAGLFFGLAGLLVAGGIFATKFVLFGEKYAKEVLNSIEKEKADLREKELDKLADIVYSACQDPTRISTILADLRSVCKEFLEGSKNEEYLTSLSFTNISNNVSELFAECIERIKEIVDISKNISNIRSRKTKAPMIDRRDQLIQEVEDCVSNVAQTLVEFKKLEAGKRSSLTSSESLSRISQDLARTLEVAKRVEERKNSELSHIDIREYQN